jgi:hypothetical protein
MKASKAIEMLKDYAPDEEIYIMWWDSEISETPLEKSDWNEIVDSLENNDIGSEEVTDYIVDSIDQIAQDKLTSGEESV